MNPFTDCGCEPYHHVCAPVLPKAPSLPLLTLSLGEPFVGHAERMLWARLVLAQGCGAEGATLGEKLKAELRAIGADVDTLLEAAANADP